MLVLEVLYQVLVLSLIPGGKLMNKVVHLIILTLLQDRLLQEHLLLKISLNQCMVVPYHIPQETNLAMTPLLLQGEGVVLV